MSILSIAGVLSLGAAGGGPLTSPATITYDHTRAGTADTSNFVALFSTTNPSFKSVANGGLLGNVNDFRFASNSGGSTLLTWEIIKWDAATGLLVAFVNIGTMSHTVDPVRYLLFDNSSRGSFLGGATGAPYDSNYKCVIVGGDGTTLDITDHTSNANNGTNNNGAVAAAGPSGLGAMVFTWAANKYITTANTINIAQPTLEAWVFLPATLGIDAALIGVMQGNSSGTTDKDISVHTDGKVHFYVYDGAQKFLVSTGALSTGAWHYVVGTADGTTQRIYIDGAEDPSGGQAAGNTFTGYGGPGLELSGTQSITGGGSPIDGSISTARLSNVARSASYVLATYNSIHSPSTFYTIA
jgi:hypothetical protein